MRRRHFSFSLSSHAKGTFISLFPSLPPFPGFPPSSSLLLALPSRRKHRQPPPSVCLHPPCLSFFLPISRLPASAVQFQVVKRSILTKLFHFLCLFVLNLDRYCPRNRVNTKLILLWQSREKSTSYTHNNGHPTVRVVNEASCLFGICIILYRNANECEGRNGIAPKKKLQQRRKRPMKAIDSEGLCVPRQEIAFRFRHEIKYVSHCSQVGLQCRFFN